MFIKKHCFFSFTVIEYIKQIQYGGVLYEHK